MCTYPDISLSVCVDGSEYRPCVMRLAAFCACQTSRHFVHLVKLQCDLRMDSYIVSSICPNASLSQFSQFSRSAVWCKMFSCVVFVSQYEWVVRKEYLSVRISSIYLYVRVYLCASQTKEREKERVCLIVCSGNSAIIIIIVNFLFTLVGSLWKGGEGPCGGLTKLLWLGIKQTDKQQLKTWKRLLLALAVGIYWSWQQGWFTGSNQMKQGIYNNMHVLQLIVNEGGLFGTK